MRALWKARGVRRRYHIGRAVRRGEKFEEPGDAALAASLARYQQAMLQSRWGMVSVATLPVLLGVLGIAAAIADDPVWLALTAGALLLLGTVVVFRRRTLSRLIRAEHANHVPPI